VLGARNGTNADVSLAILYPDGREVVHDEGRFIWDPYLDHTFEAAGDYIAAITLTRMPAGGQSRSDLNYQIAIGHSPFFWSVFPVGARLGSSCELTLRGDFLPIGARRDFPLLACCPAQYRAHSQNAVRRVTIACRSKSARPLSRVSTILESTMNRARWPR
jgi:hypothetical protein